MKEKKIDQLYRLLERAEKEKDDKSASALRWAIFTLEQAEGSTPTAFFLAVHLFVIFHFK